MLTNTSMSGAGIGTDTITGAERAQILSPSVLGTSMAVVNSTWDASAFTGPVDLEGGTGNDTLIGGSASDTLGAPVMNPTGSVEEGDDTLIGNGSGDTLRGGPGTDTARATGVTSGVVNASNMNANGIDSFNSIEVASLTGTAGADTMNGSAFGGRVIFDGAAGNDMLTGSGQNDEITGGADDDTMNAGGGTRSADRNGNGRDFGHAHRHGAQRIRRRAEREHLGLRARHAQRQRWRRYVRRVRLHRSSDPGGRATAATR